MRWVFINIKSKNWFGTSNFNIIQIFNSLLYNANPLISSSEIYKTLLRAFDGMGIQPPYGYDIKLATTYINIT